MGPVHQLSPQEPAMDPFRMTAPVTGTACFAETRRNFAEKG
jgi:hypothetical protein